jgi:polyhydroxyalkanoate synthase
LLAQPRGITLGGVKIDLRKVKTPAFLLSTREDHIAPWRSTYAATQLYSGPVKFALSASGHIAGVINPPARGKYQYWTGPQPKGDRYDNWLAKAEEHPGSWWPHWQTWIEAQDAARAKPRRVGGGKIKAIEPAPGSYVKVRA